jgi:hypothetical protein
LIVTEPKTGTLHSTEEGEGSAPGATHTEDLIDRE